MGCERPKMECWDKSEGSGRRLEHDGQGVMLSGLEVLHFGQGRDRGVWDDEEEELERIDRGFVARRYSRAAVGLSVFVSVVDMVMMSE